MTSVTGRGDEQAEFFPSIPTVARCVCPILPTPFQEYHNGGHLSALLLSPSVAIKIIMKVTVYRAARSVTIEICPR